MAEENPGLRIGRNLRAVREARLLSRPALAKRAGVGVATVDHIERGLSARPRRTTLEKLAKPLGIGVEDLIGGSAQPGATKLELAELFDAEPAVRRRALGAASEAEVARYRADLDRALEVAGREPDEHNTPNTRAHMVEYAARLGQMKAEAELLGGPSRAGVATERQGA